MSPPDGHDVTRLHPTWKRFCSKQTYALLTKSLERLWKRAGRNSTVALTRCCRQNAIILVHYSWHRGAGIVKCVTAPWSVSRARLSRRSNDGSESGIILIVVRVVLDSGSVFIGPAGHTHQTATNVDVAQDTMFCYLQDGWARTSHNYCITMCYRKSKPDHVLNLSLFMIMMALFISLVFDIQVQTRVCIKSRIAFQSISAKLDSFLQFQSSSLSSCRSL